MGQLTRYPSSPSDDWRDRISFVHAKASDLTSNREEAASRFRAVFSPLLANHSFEKSPNEKLTADDFELQWEELADEIDTDVSDVQVLHILDDTRYRESDPVADRKLLDSRAYTNTFGSLLEYIDSVVIESDSDEESEDQLP
jgi:hypothetical protein